MEDWPVTWFRDSLVTCLNNSWTIHRQGPRQLAAFTDAIRRTNNGVSRWLGIWDVDEFIFPRSSSRYETMKEYPFAELHADGWEVDRKGKIEHVKFSGADMHAQKSFADPDLVSHSWMEYTATLSFICLTD